MNATIETSCIAKNSNDFGQGDISKIEVVTIVLQRMKRKL